jgi:hypothetical protein
VFRSMTPAMLCWLQTQLRVIKAWQAELSSRPDADLQQVERLSRHHDWLTEELSRLTSTGRLPELSPGAALAASRFLPLAICLRAAPSSHVSTGEALTVCPM